MQQHVQFGRARIGSISVEGMVRGQRKQKESECESAERTDAEIELWGNMKQETSDLPPWMRDLLP